MFSKNAGNFQLYSFVRVNTGATENAEMENARRSKSDGGKPETDTHYTEFIVQLKHMMHASGPSKLQKTINSALRH